MSAVIPAILPKSREDLERKLAALNGMTDSVQIDVVDGRFIIPPCWPYAGKGAPFTEKEPFPYLGRLHYEMDLMVTEPEKIVGGWVAAGAERITIHAESTNYIARAIADLQVKYGHAKDFAPNLISLGLSINIQTELALIEPFLDQVDYVQFMGIRKIGKQGEPFEEGVLHKIDSFRRKYPEMQIQVDGGVSLDTAPRLFGAGVTRVVVGSALWEAINLPETYKKFIEIAEEYGL